MTLRVAELFAGIGAQRMALTIQVKKHDNRRIQGRI